MAQLLTRKKEAWVKQFKPTVDLRGSKLAYSAPAQMRYKAALEKLVRRMTDETEKAILKFYKHPNTKEYFAEDASVASQARILTNALSDHFDALFGRLAKPTAEKMVKEQDKASKSALHQSLKELSGGLSLKTNIFDSQISNIAKAVVAENVSLIKSIPQQYLTQVNGAVMRSISTGNGLQDLQPFLAKQKGITERRAKNMALDQTRKAYNGINKARMQNIGVGKYEWLHSGGGQQPRQEHIEMSGNIYSFDDPPVIDSKTGERGIPGQLPNCGCTMRPIISFDEGVQDDS